MPLQVECPKCRRQLQLPDSVLGKPVRCSACQGVFTAPSGVTAAPAIPALAPAPLPSPPPRPAPAPAPLPVLESWEPVTGSKPTQSTGKGSRAAKTLPPEGFEPWQLGVTVHKDHKEELSGSFLCTIQADGIRLQQAKKIDIQVPVPTRARAPGGNLFVLRLDGRDVELAITEPKLAPLRLAQDLCRFLNGKGPPPKKGDYPLPYGLFALAMLPLGIPMLTLGGAIWGGLGGGLAAANLGIARKEEWSKHLRIGAVLGISLAGYAILGLVVLLTQWSKNRPHEEDGGGGRRVVEEEPWLTPEEKAREELDKLPLRAGEVRRIRTGAKQVQQVWHSRFSPDGRTLAILANTGVCELWDHQEGIKKGSFEVGPSGQLTWASFSPDKGKYLVASAGQSQLFLRDGSSGDIRGRMDMGNRTSPYSMCSFFPDGKTLVACTADQMRFWTVPECQPVNKFAHVRLQGEAGFFSVNLAPDGKTLITGASANVNRIDQVWDLSADSPPRPLKSFSRGEYLRRMTLSPDGKLAMIYNPRLAELVDWENDRAVLLKEAPVGADYSSYSGVTFSADSNVLITGHTDGKVRFWEIPSGKELGNFPARHGDIGVVTGLGVSTDGKLLATAINAHVSLWKMDDVFPRK
jgi:LSD1 subclass zinc finger protein